MMNTMNMTMDMHANCHAIAPTLPSTRLSVFDMNTKAVVCLKEGRGMEGMEGLRETLIHTRTLLMQHQQLQQQVTTTSNNTMQCDVPPLSLFTVPLNFSPASNSDSAHCPLFDRAFVVGGDNDDSDACLGNSHCQNVTLGVLLYNLALSHHLSALQKGALAAQEFQVAMNLYQMALSLVETSIREPTQECQNLVLLLCAIFNNMANIHARHFHVEETRNCLECLKEIVSNDNACATTEQEDQFFFYLNLFVAAPVHDFAIAPAA